MIGQRCVQQQIKSAIESKSLAQFIILVGEKGSGRKTLAKEIAKMTDAEYAVVDKGVDAIREIIDDILYVLDGDSMSSSAKSSLLKVTEEPPKHVRFVLIFTHSSQTLNTLTSRACVYRMYSYTHADITQFAGIEDWRYPNFCTNKYEVDLLQSYGIEEFHNFVKLVVDNIDIVESANALKIEEKLAFKDTDKGYDMKIFLQAFRTECMDRVQDIVGRTDKMKYFDWVKITTKKLSLLRVSSINKQSLCDMWIFDIRAVSHADS